MSEQAQHGERGQTLRLRPEIEAERQGVRDRTEREIDQIVADAHTQLPRGQAEHIGALYARYSTQHQHSIPDQVRTLLEAAVRQHIFVPRDNICFDIAVTVCKERRPGLDRLRSLLALRATDVLLVFSTNRLFRKTYKSLQFVEEEVVERGIRCQFVKTGIDTADEKQWRMLLQVHAITDEAVLGMYGDNIRAAHEGLFDRRLVCGTITFGYRGEPVQGELTKKRTSRRLVVIDDAESLWVRQVFEWYVRDKRSISEIVRRLNADGAAPLNRRSSIGRWTHQSVRKLLANPRYRGHWRYGETKNIWQSKKDYSRQVPRPEPLRAEQFEELRIIDDATWYEAQTRLAEQDRSRSGRKPRDGDRKRRPRLAHGLFYCPTHNRALYVGGVHGRYLQCKHCQGENADSRTLFSQLPRQRAVRLTCERLAALVRDDEALVASIEQAFLQHVSERRQANPAQLDELHRTDTNLSRQIEFLLQNAGDTDQDRRETTVTLKRLRQERAAVQAQLGQLQRGAREIVPPTGDEIAAQLDQLSDVLMRAASSEDETEVALARQVIRLITGGRIDLYQQGERHSHRGWLQGRLRVRLLPYLLEKMGATRTGANTEAAVEVVIDYRDDAFERRCDRAKELLDQGLRHREIAATLGCAPSRLTLLLRHWHESRGLPVPDGRKRRRN
jgi:DNA invertase Pin-like site-specific DNA recombinase